jgi:hypothetical protein
VPKRKTLGHRLAEASRALEEASWPLSSSTPSLCKWKSFMEERGELLVVEVVGRVGWTRRRSGPGFCEGARAIERRDRG